MLSWWAIALLAPAVAIAIVDWRKGLFALLAVAFLQDPARKQELDQPVYFTVLAAIVLAVVFLRAQFPKPMSIGHVAGWRTYLRVPSILFLLLVLVEGSVSIATYGNSMLVLIGAASYLAPVPAMLVGYHYALRTGRSGVERWLAWYLVGALIVLPSIVLEYAGVGWQSLGQVGVGFDTYIDGQVLTSHSGFFRASETAAWHAGTAVCLLLLLSSMRKLSGKQIFFASMVVLALLTIGVLTGRRKMFVEVAIFVSGYVALLLLFGKGGLRVAAAVFLGGLASYAALSWLTAEQSQGMGAEGAVAYHYYAQRSATVAGDITDRFLELGLAPVQWAIDGYGWLGGGLGIASQGAQYFGGGSEVFGGAGEGGLGKLTAELGVPGLIVALWLMVAMCILGWRILVFVSPRSSAVARLAYGLAALSVANMATFFVATQVFGDMFILTMLGLISGFYLATPTLAERERAGQMAGGASGALAKPRVPPNGFPARVGAPR